MASILRVDTLTDASSNNSTAMSVVHNGTAKNWVNFNGTGTIATRDSYNTSSMTDNGTGDYTVNFTSNMANANYSASFYSGLKSITWGLPIFIGLSGAGNSDSHSTSKFRVGSTAPNDLLTDNIMCNVITVGDLA